MRQAPIRLTPGRSDRLVKHAILDCELTTWSMLLPHAYPHDGVNAQRGAMLRVVGCPIVPVYRSRGHAVIVV